MKGRWFSVARTHLGVRDAAPAAAAPSRGGGTESRRGRVAVRRPALLNTPCVSEAPRANPVAEELVDQDRSAGCVEN